MSYDVFKENSGLSLNLEWRTLGKEQKDDPYSIWGPPAWLDAGKLKELGFNVDDFLSPDIDPDDYKNPLPKEVFIVLEKDGEPYREAIQRAEANHQQKKALAEANPGNEELQQEFKWAQSRLEDERTKGSRLFAVDAGLDFTALQNKYSDQSRFIIIKGKLRAGYHGSRKNKEVSGYVEHLLIEAVHVPLKQRRLFDAIRDKPDSGQDGVSPPRYAVELAFGSRLEPWIVSVKSLHK